MIFDPSKLLRIAENIERIGNTNKSQADLALLNDEKVEAARLQRRAESAADSARQIREAHRLLTAKAKKAAPVIMADDEDARALAKLCGRREGTPWSEIEVAKFKKLKKAGAFTAENLAALAVYYLSERQKGDGGRHRRDLTTFLNNFSGELDRAHAMGQAKAPKPAVDLTKWKAFLAAEYPDYTGSGDYESAPNFMKDKFRKWGAE